MPVFSGADDPEVSRLHGPRPRPQDGHQERQELHRGGHCKGQELPDRAPGRQQQGSLTGCLPITQYDNIYQMCFPISSYTACPMCLAHKLGQLIWRRCICRFYMSDTKLTII